MGRWFTCLVVIHRPSIFLYRTRLDFKFIIEGLIAKKSNQMMIYDIYNT